MDNKQIFSLCTKLNAVLDHSILRAKNFGFSIRAPFNWSLINTAVVLVRMQEEGDRNYEREDQLKIKMATLREFNRRATGHNEVGMGEIKNCLKPDEKEVSLEDMGKRAREKIQMDVLKGRVPKTQAKMAYLKLRSDYYEQACAEKRQLARLVDEVSFLCNRSDEILNADNFERSIEAGTAYPDAELVDFDQYDYMLESLLEKMTMPVIQAKEFLASNRSYRTTVLAAVQQLDAELEAIGKAIGINFDKIEAEKKAIAAEFDAGEAETNLDAVFDMADAEFSEAIAENKAEESKPQRTLIKSPERLAREAEETEARAQQLEQQKKDAAKAAKAAATRAANAAAKANGSTRPL